MSKLKFQIVTKEKFHALTFEIVLRKKDV